MGSWASSSAAGRHSQAAVYGEARVEGFDGQVLRLVYPEEQSFHVGMARDPAHLEKLGAVLEERLGSKPRLEIRAAGGESAAPAAEEPPPAPEPRPGPEPRPRREPRMDRRPDAQKSNGPAPEATAEDGVIQNEREVFEIAREYDLFDENERG